MVSIRPLLIDKLSSILIPQDGAIALEGFVLLEIMVSNHAWKSRLEIKLRNAEQYLAIF